MIYKRLLKIAKEVIIQDKPKYHIFIEKMMIKQGAFINIGISLVNEKTTNLNDIAIYDNIVEAQKGLSEIAGKFFTKYKIDEKKCRYKTVKFDIFKEDIEQVYEWNLNVDIDDNDVEKDIFKIATKYKTMFPAETY